MSGKQTSGKQTSGKQTSGKQTSGKQTDSRGTGAGTRAPSGATNSGVSQPASRVTRDREGRNASRTGRSAQATSDPGSSLANQETGDASERASPAGSRFGRGVQVVGVGASAGGLEALEEFFRSLPPKPEMAFVVVTHKHPGHVSVLPELLRRCTDMTVEEATDGVQLGPGHVYIAPADHYLAILKGRLQFMASSTSSGLHLPVDYFFRSLAEDQQERAVGIVLSGTGSDGTLGIAAIKAEAGLVMAQNPDSAKHGGMPSSAATMTVMDYMEPPEALARRLVQYVAGARLGSGFEAEAHVPEVWRKVFVLLRKRTGHDFSSYKPNTIRRRFQRRMNVHQLERPEQYLRYLEENARELDVLFKELLIGVTGFFRDSGAWDALRKTLREKLVAREDDEPFRVWVVGCSTGEEAYTIGIVLREIMEESKRFLPAQVFATDINTDAIATARAGRYPAGIATDVRAECLARFFVKDDNGFRISKDIRETVVFAPQNVIKDPPFTKLDLLSCRNLLIYFEQEVQKQLLPLFHYALRPGGILLLGPSETTTGFPDLFALKDKKWRIFERKPGDAEVRLGRRGLPLPPIAAPVSSPIQRQSGQPALPLAAAAERMLLSLFVPPAVLINERGDIVYIHGRTGGYLEPASGEPTHNAYVMAREGLRLELPALVRQAVSSDEAIVRAGVGIKTNGGYQRTLLTVRRLREPQVMSGLFLVAFEPEPEPEPESRPPPKASGATGRNREGARRVGWLEQELQHTKETLQGTIGELETSNEELKSTNEELQSLNEELQSANEELETSKEEMQSLNEELQTVNAELENKMDDLSRANDDMQNLLNSTEFATIFLDNELRIKRFTEQARQVVRVIEADIGRPIADLAHQLQYDRLVEDAEDVLRTLDRREREVRTKDGAWRLLRMVPYRTAENVIDGLVITVVDIDKVKRAERSAREAQSLAEHVLMIADTGLVVLDGELHVISANEPFCRVTGLAIQDVVGRIFWELASGRWNVPQLRNMLEKTVDEGGAPARAIVMGVSDGERELAVTAQRVEVSPDAGRIVLVVQDAMKRLAPQVEGE